jgi:rod shape determining protein RodA
MEHRIDPWMILAACGVLAASLATLHAVSRVIGPELVVRQLLWGAAGLAVLWLLSRVHLRLYERLAPAAYVVSMVALLAVLLVGETRGGTRGWFAFGPVTLQPSEFARLGTVLMAASWLSRHEGNRLRARDVWALGAFVGGATCLVALEPDLGVALTYVPILIVGLWLGGLHNRVWVILVLLGLVGSVVGWQGALKPYQKERVLTVLNPERDPYGAGYQLRQSKIAVGAGGVIGQGLGRGSQSALRFLPAQQTDFVFAVWAEATGFLGALGLLAAYALLLSRICLVALRSETKHGLMICALVGASMAFQIIINLGMVLGWLPTTGITLPLFSYGGSSLLSTCAALGIVQSVWRYRLVNL